MSAMMTLAPIKHRSPIDTSMPAQIEAPLIPVSLPTEIVAFGQSVRRIIGWFTPKAVYFESDASEHLSPIVIAEDLAKETIGVPKNRAEEATRTPLRLSCHGTIVRQNSSLA